MDEMLTKTLSSFLHVIDCIMLPYIHVHFPTLYNDVIIQLSIGYTIFT